MAAQARRPLRFGIQLQAQRVSWIEYLEAVKAVEGLGFDTLWNFDHLLPFAGDPTQPCFETWTTLAALAMATDRIRIGALVNGVMYRDPATLASQASCNLIESRVPGDALEVLEILVSAAFGGVLLATQRVKHAIG